MVKKCYQKFTFKKFPVISQIFDSRKFSEELTKGCPMIKILDFLISIYSGLKSLPHS
jgi:hypothetical protein